MTDRSKPKDVKAPAAAIRVEAIAKRPKSLGKSRRATITDRPNPSTWVNNIEAAFQPKLLRTRLGGKKEVDNRCVSLMITAKRYKAGILNKYS
jgi:hypothetical protein